MRALAPLALLALGMASLTLGNVAFAQEGSDQQRMQAFQAADVNHDGHVSLQEFEAFVRARMAQSSGMRASMFNRLSPADQNSRLEAKFSQMDASCKGYLTPDEWHLQS